MFQTKFNEVLNNEVNDCHYLSVIIFISKKVRNTPLPHIVSHFFAPSLLLRRKSEIGCSEG